MLYRTFNFISVCEYIFAEAIIFGYRPSCIAAADIPYTLCILTWSRASHLSKALLLRRRWSIDGRNLVSIYNLWIVNSDNFVYVNLVCTKLWWYGELKSFIKICVCWYWMYINKNRIYDIDYILYVSFYWITRS